MKCRSLKNRYSDCFDNLRMLMTLVNSSLAFYQAKACSSSGRPVLNEFKCGKTYQILHSKLCLILKCEARDAL